MCRYGRGGAQERWDPRETWAGGDGVTGLPGVVETGTGLSACAPKSCLGLDQLGAPDSLCKLLSGIRLRVWCGGEGKGSVGIAYVAGGTGKRRSFPTVLSKHLGESPPTTPPPHVMNDG